jgi:ubiquinone/menaquinone biosynthesis C-methylase UbiE
VTTSAPDKRSHAYANIAHRERKAEKILRLIETARSLLGCNILEVGAGAGVISRSLSRAAGATGSVEAVDVVDERVVTDGYRFTQVSDTRLPFPDASFDIVVSNHVIKHVGPRKDQRAHLNEIRRVLRTNGLLYLAVPNRWTLIEPHYRRPLLSWLPHGLADRYISSLGRGARYDCWPPGPFALRRLFEKSGLTADNLCSSAARLAIEKGEHTLLANA